jgi:3-dehydroquinate synthase
LLFGVCEEIVNVTKSDKKMDKGSVRFILLSAIGKAVICHDVSDAELLMAAREICNL